MAEHVIVIGGTGFLGSRVVGRLRERGRAVTVGSRSADGAAGKVRADVRDRASLARAFEGAAAVVNCVGLYVETRGASFHDIHVEGARAVAEEARGQGVRRLVHISGIGADAGSSSRYIRARGEGEEAVRQAFPEATVLRPSAMFSADAGFFAALAPIVRTLPVVPLFGAGATRLQPVHVDDVAEAAARVLDSDTALGKVFELGGPDVFTYREIVERLSVRAGKRRILVPLPFVFWHALATVASLLPGPPLTPGQVDLMRRDNVVGEGVAGFADLGISPRSALADGLV